MNVDGVSHGYNSLYADYNHSVTVFEQSAVNGDPGKHKLVFIPVGVNLTLKAEKESVTPKDVETEIITIASREYVAHKMHGSCPCR
jgi:hypothetical protein